MGVTGGWMLTRLMPSGMEKQILARDLFPSSPPLTPPPLSTTTLEAWFSMPTLERPSPDRSGASIFLEQSQSDERKTLNTIISAERNCGKIYIQYVVLALSIKPQKLIYYFVAKYTNKIFQ